MDSKTKQIVTRAINILKANPNGVHYAELVKRTLSECPHFRESVVRNTVYWLPLKHSEQVYKPDKGLYRHTDFREQPPPEPEPPRSRDRLPEAAFYNPFANWLMDEEECTKAIPLGGNKFKDRWGTPDVIGILECRKGNLIRIWHRSRIGGDQDQHAGPDHGLRPGLRLQAFQPQVIHRCSEDAPDADLKKIESLCLISRHRISHLRQHGRQDPAIRDQGQP